MYCKLITNAVITDIETNRPLSPEPALNNGHSTVSGARVFIPFHWVFEAEEERKQRKEREKGEIVGNQAHLLCFVKSTV